MEVDIELLKSSATIDVNNLVEECARQPALYMHACELLGEARNELRRAKALLDITKAEVEFQIRKQPATYGVLKITEASIAAALNKENNVVQARTDLIDAEKKVDTAQSLVGMFEQRRSMLKAEVDMLISQYYGTSTPQGVGETENKIAKMRMEQGGMKQND